MADKTSHTYYAGVDMLIQSKKITAGTIIGTGNIEAGEFTPAKGLENHVALGHCQARLQIGGVVTENPTRAPTAKADDAPNDDVRDSRPRSTAGRKSKQASTIKRKE